MRGRKALAAALWPLEALMGVVGWTGDVAWGVLATPIVGRRAWRALGRRRRRRDKEDSE